MIDTLKKIFKPKNQTLNTIFINEKNIIENLDFLKKTCRKEYIFPVLKSNAYGHGIKQMLEIFQKNKQNFSYLAVDSFPEYHVIYKKSKYHILLMSETLLQNYSLFDFRRTAFAIYNTETLLYLEKIARKKWKKAKIHLFLNTGMNREWIQIQDLPNFLQILKNLKNIELEGVMSHFHSADNPKNHANALQIENFKKMYTAIQANGFSPKYRHISASGGIFFENDNFFNASRVWLAMYGYSPLQEKKIPELKPAFSLISHITSIQKLQPHDGVSYWHNWKADKPSFAITTACGYFEGLPRNASGKIFYKYQENYLPQIGNICMNISSCQSEKLLKIWEEIELISCHANDKNSLENLANASDKIIYETLVHFDKNIRRIIF